MKPISIITLLVAFCGLISQAQHIVPLTSAPQIDGIIDENDPWTETWIPQDSIKGITDAMSSHFQIVHDNENIYILVEVIDSTPSIDPDSIGASYERDCIETHFSMKSSNHENGTYTYGDHQIRCQRSSLDNTYIDGISANTDLPWAPIDSVLLENMLYAVKGDSLSYIIELSFNIQALDYTSDFDGSNFRFDLGTSDNSTGTDGERTQQRFWNSATDTPYPNTTYFGSMKLKGIDTAINPKLEGKDNSIKPYPNPASETLTISLLQNIESLCILNMQGKEVYRLEELTSDKNVYTIDVSTLPNGIYFVKAGTKMTKIIKN